GYLLALCLRKGGPGRADRKSRHRSDVETAANNRLKLRETAALAQCPAILHRAEQRVVEALHSIAAARRRGMARIGKDAEADPSGKRYSFPQSRCLFSSWDH